MLDLQWVEIEDNSDKEKPLTRPSVFHPFRFRRVQGRGNGGGVKQLPSYKNVPTPPTSALLYNKSKQIQTIHPPDSRPVQGPEQVRNLQTGQCTKSERVLY